MRRVIVSNRKLEKIETNILLRYFVVLFIVLIVSRGELILLEPRWWVLTNILVTLPTGLLQVAIFILRWCYGYMKKDTLLAEMANAIVYGMAVITSLAIVTVYVSDSEFAALSCVPIWLEILFWVAAIINAVLLVMLLRNVWQDHCEWKRSEHPYGYFAAVFGSQPLNFRDFVKEYTEENSKK